jgi:hypothetical protein
MLIIYATANARSQAAVTLPIFGAQTTYIGRRLTSSPSSRPDSLSIECQALTSLLVAGLSKGICA